MKLHEVKSSHPGFYTNPDDILEWLRDFTTADLRPSAAAVTIHESGIVDYDGPLVFLLPADLQYIRVQFGIVSGDFDISSCVLLSLKGCPREITGNFDCSKTRISSLEDGPREVGGEYRAIECFRLSSLRGCARNIGRGLNIHHNPEITSLDGLENCTIHSVYFQASECAIEHLKSFPRIQNVEYVDLSRNKIKSMEGLPSTLNFSLDLSQNLIATLDNLPTLATDAMDINLTHNDIIVTRIKDSRMSYDNPLGIDIDEEGKLRNTVGSVYMF